MKEKINEYLNEEFRIYSNTEKMREFKRELYCLMCETYDDCRKKGLSESASYITALASAYPAGIYKKTA